MGLLSQLKAAVVSFLSRLLGSVRDPVQEAEYAYEQLLERRTDIDRSWVEIRAAVHELESEQEEIKKKLDWLDAQINENLRAGDEEGAKVLLAEYIGLKEQFDQISESLSELKATERQIEAARERFDRDIRELRVKKDNLAAQYKAFGAMVSVQRELAGLGSTSDSLASAISELERKVNKLRAESKALRDFLERKKLAQTRLEDVALEMELEKRKRELLLKTDGEEIEEVRPEIKVEVAVSEEG